MNLYWNYATKNLSEYFQDPKHRENSQLSVSSPPKIYGCLHTFLVFILPVCAVSRAVKNHSSRSCALARNTYGNGMNVHEALVKGAFVQLGSP